MLHGMRVCTCCCTLAEHGAVPRRPARSLPPSPCSKSTSNTRDPAITAVDPNNPASFVDPNGVPEEVREVLEAGCSNRHCMPAVQRESAVPGTDSPCEILTALPYPATLPVLAVLRLPDGRGLGGRRHPLPRVR